MSSDGKPVAADTSVASAKGDDARPHAASPFLRDLLAADRTRLANERTLLSYVRTALGLLAAGAGVLYLSDVKAFDVTAGVLAAIGVGTLVVGVVRYRGVARDLAAFRSGIDAWQERTRGGGHA